MSKGHPHLSVNLLFFFAFPRPPHTQSLSISLDACGSSFDALIAIATTAAGDKLLAATPSSSAASMQACPDGTFQSRVTHDFEGGSEYFIILVSRRRGQAKQLLAHPGSRFCTCYSTSGRVVCERVRAFCSHSAAHSLRRPADRVSGQRGDHSPRRR